MTQITVANPYDVDQGGITKILTDHTSWDLQFQLEGSSNWSAAETQSTGSKQIDPFNGKFQVSAASGGTFIEFTVTPII